MGPEANTHPTDLHPYIIPTCMYWIPTVYPIFYSVAYIGCLYILFYLFNQYLLYTFCIVLF